MKKVILSCLKMNLYVCVRKFDVLDKNRKGGSLHEVRGDCLKYLKRGWNRKEGVETKSLKGEGGKLG